VSYPLTYVCKWCGETIATYPDVAAEQPTTLSVCDKRECREQASKAYKS
jgi:hypothetical protein